MPEEPPSDREADQPDDSPPRTEPLTGRPSPATERITDRPAPPTDPLPDRPAPPTERMPDRTPAPTERMPDRPPAPAQRPPEPPRREEPPSESTAPAEPARPRPGRNLKVAIIAGLTLAALAIGALILGRGPFFGLALVLILIAEAEFFLAVRKAGYDPATALGLVSGLVLMAGSYFRGETAIPLVMFLTIVFAFVWFMAGVTKSDVATSIGVSILGVAYAPLLGAFAGLMLRRPDGRGVILATIGAAALYDVFAYAAGSKWGRHPLAPKISPKKTIEGAALATLAILILGTVVAPLLGPWNYVQAFVFAGLICISAPVGDLIESRIKRDLGIKDIGVLIPGHGGALDRLDAVLFSAPAAYLSLRLFGL